MAEPLYDVATLWELLDRRASASHRRADAARRGRPAGDLRRVRGVGRAGRRRLRRPGHRRRHARSPGSCRPASRRSSLSMALARLGAVQNPIIPIYREREVGLRAAPDRRRAVLRARRLARLRLRGDGRAASAGHRRAAAVARRLRHAARGRPGHAAAAADRRRRRPLDLLHVGHDRRTPRASGTPTAPCSPAGMGLAVALGMSPDDVGSIAFPFAHIGGPDYLVTMPGQRASRRCCSRRSCPTRRSSVFRAHGVTMAGGSTAFYTAFLDEQRKRPGREAHPDACGSCRAAARPSRPRSSTRCKREMGVPVAHGYGMTEVPMITPGLADRHRRAAGQHRGRAGAGAEVRIVLEDGTLAPPPASRARCGCAGPMVCKGYTDPALDAAAFDDDGYFRTGDLGQVRRRRPRHAHRAAQGHHHPQGREHLRQGDRGPPLRAPEGRRRGRHRPARPRAGRAGVRRGRGRRPAPSRRRFGEMVDYLPRGRADGAEDPRAARGRRRAAPQRHPEDPQVPAPRRAGARSRGLERRQSRPPRSSPSGTDRPVSRR